MKNNNDPLGKSFSSIVDDIKNIDDVTLNSFEKTLLDKNTPKKMQSSTQDRNIKGGVIQKTLPVVNVDDDSMVFQLDKVGQILRQKRVEKGLSTSQISETLCCRRLIVESIESGNWDNLPHKVYVKGYIRKYSALLGTDGDIAPYMVEKPQEEKPGVSQDHNPPVKKKFEIKTTKIKRPISIRFPRISKTTFVYFGIVILIISFFMFDSIRKDNAATSNLEKTTHVSNSISGMDENKNSPQFTDTKKLMITCHDRTWVSVIIDGGEKKELMLKPEEVIVLNAKERFDLLVGNAGGINIFLNGKDTGFTGEKGQVKRITLS